ncbi:MAG: mechanosensitive ion channel protein MscL [Candidatus Doudnabacteria bacterium RIFCSPLOWO2_02_FULL_49_13]|uniref:Large-conductance mechanosensitive channel n=1 Tax=Candidatus Doudnabacteria bacterium RIFCSPHIGHO2_12_FULL_48_16 TaxID=1817838 RepID=A0A1F5PKC7_9BACT|nr:MAG: mechanosensitive ion channel protein MscL [Candidatus Doudnabacteria bacterium RIFCSPHIGHO2_02_FULL_49_24]OGE89617.1 MAG: mechanosensitive ion channel protein MscL [Candidatus Doudnabacteria bacterium RIFCSPHIGHO2_01_FULL_50_67]OGE90405.1 MAG: mechanosensitive ion channel protein MscL [Candidatus Doudnabacteria bacterium RIFCSPHIGHO2_12_FULL_48_16]OGE96635.1 MAG: mechanosensitive ion channel protein MscL [Candidatus Doudnabacteria bacterium RIFCSPLOWO2_01_FULL_49_40]OGF02919.1 MAG: mech
MWKEFKEFAVRGNALDLAVGVIIGAAFGQVVNSIINDLFNPILSLIIGQVDFHNITIGLPGRHTLALGSFINTVINFTVVSFVIFLVVKQMNRFRRRQSDIVHTKECPYCRNSVSINATRCPFCTSQL